MNTKHKRKAVILFNLGGPSNLQSVKPFLYNLFNDPAIINLPWLFRMLLARIVSSKRAKSAKKIYSQIGGKSPLLEFTEEQRKGLEMLLTKSEEEYIYKVFICMRYWHPMSAEVVEQVKKYDPDEILLLPLYPQFSTTTSGSALLDWYESSKKADLKKPTFFKCCYYTDTKWISAQAELLKEKLDQSSFRDNTIVLFSAHGLPEKIVKSGDPYQWQVEQTARAIANSLDLSSDNWRVCYQSRVGPLKWIGPSLDEAMKVASISFDNIVVLPVAFVSEHSETLVELDIEYKEIAKNLGIPGFIRVPAVGSHPDFIECLRQLVLDGFEKKLKIGPKTGAKVCDSKYDKCPA